MQHPHVSCQLQAPRTGQVAPENTPQFERACVKRKRWTPDPAETIEHTTARHSSPRAWRRDLEHAVELGLIPGFTAATRAIVEVLQTRMGFDTGHARYVLADVLKRTGLKRAAVTKHVALLRRAGWLAWVEHGSLRNALRAVGRPGYARTATVYAATIPPAYDALAGRRLAGTGYEARVVGVTEEARPKPPVDTAGTPAVDTPGKAPVENPDGGDAWTPSRWVVTEEGQVQVVGGKDSSTGQARTAPRSPRRKKRKFTVTGYRITGPRIDLARQMAARVRPLVNWVQGATLAELSWVLLDLVAREWTEPRIVAWLGKLGREIGAPRWRPRFPHRVIAAAILREDEAAALQAVPDDLQHEEYKPAVAPHAEYMEALEKLRHRVGGPAEDVVSYGEYGEHDTAVATTWELAQQQKAVIEDPALVLAAARIGGREAALRTYGTAGARILDLHAEMQAAGFSLPTAAAV